MTTFLPRASWRPSDDYDDESRWLDDQDQGWRWQDYRACRDVDPELFFPVVVRRERRVERHGPDVVEVTVDVPTDEEPPLPPPEVAQICHRCPVSGRCLERNLDAPYGIFGGTTGYQRGLLNKKIVRKRCPICTSTDLVLSQTQRQELCLGCGHSWDVL